MNTISDRIKTLLSNRKLTVYRVSKDLGIQQTTLQRSLRTPNTWKTAHLISIARYFNVTLDWLLMGGTVLAAVEERSKAIRERRFKPVPVLGIADCGLPASEWASQHYKTIDLADIEGLHNPFVLIARGDSMVPYINPGDKLLCSDSPERIKNRTGVVVLFKSPAESTEANAKLIYFLKNDEIMLYSINTKYEPRSYRKSEIQKIFKLVRIIRDVK